MDRHLREIREIEIGQLNLSYAHTRIERPKESLALAASIERVGQIIPVIVTSTLVLLDGYIRVAALKRCGHDMVMAEIWARTEEEALVEILARAHGIKWDFIEEAAIVRELHDHHHLSQGRIASLVGRTHGWVSGRLALYSALPDPYKASPCQQTILPLREKILPFAVLRTDHLTVANGSGFVSKQVLFLDSAPNAYRGSPW